MPLTEARQRLYLMSSGRSDKVCCSKEVGGGGGLLDFSDNVPLSKAPFLLGTRTRSTIMTRATERIPPSRTLVLKLGFGLLFTFTVLSAALATKTTFP